MLRALGYMTEQRTLTSKEQAVTVPFVGFTDANGSGCRRCQPPSLENTNDYIFPLFFPLFLFPDCPLDFALWIFASSRG